MYLALKFNLLIKQNPDVAPLIMQYHQVRGYLTWII